MGIHDYRCCRCLAVPHIDAFNDAEVCVRDGQGCIDHSLQHFMIPYQATTQSASLLSTVNLQKLVVVFVNMLALFKSLRNQRSWHTFFVHFYVLSKG